MPKYAAIFRGDEAAAAAQQQQGAVVLVRLLELMVDQLKANIGASRPNAVRYARIAHAVLNSPEAPLADFEKLDRRPTIKGGRHSNENVQRE